MLIYLGQKGDNMKEFIGKIKLRLYNIDSLKLRITAGLCGTLIAGGTIGYVMGYEKGKKENKKEQIEIVNETRGNIEVGFQTDNEKFNLLCLDFEFDEKGHLIGDYQKIIDEVKNKNEDVGIVLRLKNNNLVDVYLALNKIKEIMTNIDVNFPIYFDVDSLLDESYEMVVSFLERAEYDGMFVGMAGKEVTIHKYMDLFIENGKEALFRNTDILMYDSLTNNSDKYSMVRFNDTYYAQKDFDRITVQYKFNLPNNFKDDYIHIVQENEDMDTIQSYYGVDDIEVLYKYNSLDIGTKLEESQQIKVPMLLRRGQSVVFNSNLDRSKYVSDEVSYVKGIDVSENNYVDWNSISLKNKMDFAILRLCNTYNTIDLDNYNGVDSLFNYHYNGCIKNDIPKTFYIFCQWHSFHSKEEVVENARKEAQYFVDYIENNNYTPDMNVLFFDYEGTNLDGGFQRSDCTSEIIELIMNTHKEVVEQSGYTYGVYANCAVLNKINTDNFPNTTFWIAGGETYSWQVDFSNDLMPNQLSTSLLHSSNPTKFGIAIQQISEYGSLKGYDGPIDINVMPYDWYRYLNDLQLEKNNQRVLN